MFSQGYLVIHQRNQWVYDSRLMVSIIYELTYRDFVVKVARDHQRPDLAGSKFLTSKFMPKRSCAQWMADNTSMGPK